MRNASVALLVLILSVPTVGADKEENIVFPPAAGAVNVREVYGVKGDGVTDDTAAIQGAIDDAKGWNKTLYFPNGTYLVSNVMNVGNKAHSMDRFVSFQGQSEAGTIIKLKDNCPGYQDPKKPKLVLSLFTGGTGDAMHSYVRHLTVDIGRGNPAAIGLRFMTNNSGAMYNVTVKSSDPERVGAIGLDLSCHQFGPGYIKNVTVIGFDRAVTTGSSFSMVLEHLRIEGQRVCGFANGGGNVTIRDLKSRNKVPAIISDQRSIILTDAELTGGDPAATAIINNFEDMYLRDVKQSGYGHLLQKKDRSLVDGAELKEWHEGMGYSLFGNQVASLRLPVEETPEVPWETDLTKWEIIDWRADDDSEAAQKAFDNAAAQGKTTVCFPKPKGKIGTDYPWGWFKLSKTIRVHGSVNRIIGMSNEIVITGPTGKGDSMFVLEDLKSPTIVFERFFTMGKGQDTPRIYLVDNRTDAVVVVKNMATMLNLRKPGKPGSKFFIEDVVGLPLELNKGERCWARQWNPESPRTTMSVIDGGIFWLLGIKTEGRSVHVEVKNGGKAEVIGSIAYQSWDGPIDPPIFVVANADLSAVIAVHGRTHPFTKIVAETISGETRTLIPTQSNRLGHHLPLYRSGKPGGLSTETTHKDGP